MLCFHYIHTYLPAYQHMTTSEEPNDINVVCRKLPLIHKVLLWQEKKMRRRLVQLIVVSYLELFSRWWMNTEGVAVLLLLREEALQQWCSTGTLLVAHQTRRPKEKSKATQCEIYFGRVLEAHRKKRNPNIGSAVMMPWTDIHWK